MFMLTGAQQELRREIRAFVDSEIAPRAEELDRTGAYPREIVGKISERGWCALPFPAELGGAGLGAVEGLIFLEELSRGLCSLGLVMCAHMFQCCYALRNAVSPQQARDWLMPAIAGKKILTLALSEERGGSEALGIDAVAVRTEDGWVLNGEKCWITNAGIADGYIAGVRTGTSNRSRSVSLFYVDAGWEGVTVTRQEDMIGLNNSPTGTVTFKDCRLPPESLIGTENGGYKAMKETLNCGRLALAAVAIGTAQSAFENAVEYSRSRGSFDRTISSYQGVSFPIAEMYTNICVARNMLYHVAALTEAGARATMETAALKLFATEMCQKACRDAALIHGSRGYTAHSATERLLRDAQLLTVAEGTSQICKVAISNGIYNSPMSELN